MIPILVELIYSQPPLISFKRDKNIGNFLFRSAIQTSDQHGTCKCARARCNGSGASETSLGSLLLMSHGAS